jgi:hypothetical protein
MRKIAILGSTAFYLTATNIAFAEPQPISLTQQSNQGLQSSTPLQQIIQNAISIIFAIAAIVVLFMLLWGGIQWMLSGGEKEKVAEARKRVEHALIGMAIVAVAFVLVTVVGKVVGFNPTNIQSIPSLGNPS